MAAVFQDAPRQPPLFPFIVAVTLLHVAVLSWLPPLRSAPPPLPRPLELFLIAPEIPSTPTTVATPIRPRSLSTTSTSPDTASVPQVPPAISAPVLNQEISNWQEIARATARASAREEAQTEQAREHTPLAELKRALQQPHSEEQLANGLLKITSANGQTLCFQPPPAFAHDLKNLYGIPSTCP